jgi:hypothetical protein
MFLSKPSSSTRWIQQSRGERERKRERETPERASNRNCPHKGPPWVHKKQTIPVCSDRPKFGRGNSARHSVPSVAIHLPRLRMRTCPQHESGNTPPRRRVGGGGLSNQSTILLRPAAAANARERPSSSGHNRNSQRGHSALRPPLPWPPNPPLLLPPSSSNSTTEQSINTSPTKSATIESNGRSSCADAGIDSTGSVQQEAKGIRSGFGDWRIWEVAKTDKDAHGG